jgi:hypothetical protein
MAAPELKLNPTGTRELRRARPSDLPLRRPLALNSNHAGDASTGRAGEKISP